MSNSLSINEIQFKKISKKIHKNIKDSSKELSLMNIQEIIASSAGFNNLHSLTTFFNQENIIIENDIPKNILLKNNSKTFLNTIGLDGLYDFYKYCYSAEHDIMKKLISIFEQVIKAYKDTDNKIYTLNVLYDKSKQFYENNINNYSNQRDLIDFFNCKEDSNLFYFFKAMIRNENNNVILFKSTWLQSDKVEVGEYIDSLTGNKEKYYSFISELFDVPFFKNSWLYTQDFFDFLYKNYQGKTNICITMIDLINYINNTISPKMKAKYMDLYFMLASNFDKVKTLSEKVENIANK